MDFDEMQRTWQSQGSGPQLAIDPEMLLNEIRRNKRSLEATVFWRDVINVGLATLGGAFFIRLGITLPYWPWLLPGLSMLWMAGFMFVDRMRWKRNTPLPREPVTACIESSLAQVNHQVWLMQNVLWWCVLPNGVGFIFLFCSLAWESRQIPLVSLINLAFAGLCAVFFWFVYWLNQVGARKGLEPRQQELEALLDSLKTSENGDPDHERLEN